MRLLGIDYGSKRVGVAISDESGEFAMPYSVLKNKHDLLTQLINLCHEKKINSVVIGESKNFQGQVNPIMGPAKVLAEAIERETALPVFFEPELFTSAEAERVQGKNKNLDASAAALILKSFIEKHKK